MSEKCSTSNLYDSLRFCDGTTVLPGIRRKAYFIQQDNIAKYPELPNLSDENVKMGELACYKGDFTLVADATFKVIDLDDSASNVICDSQGDKPSKSFINKAKFKHPGKGEEATGFARLANASNLLFIYQERDGSFRVVGNDKFTTNVKVTQESGAKETDASGTTLNIEVSDTCAAPFYKGIIKTDAGDIDASTGALVEQG